MASGIAADTSSRLRRVLSALERRARLPSPHDIDDLKEAAQRRGHDYTTVRNVLEDLTDLEEEDEWIFDFLNMDGNSKNGLAKILVDEKHDSPWIFRPTCFEAISVEDLTSSSSTHTPLAKPDSSAPSDQVPQNEADALRASMQTLSLLQNRNLEGGGKGVLDLRPGNFIAKDDSGSVSSLPAFKNWTLGIAGYLPVEFKRFSTHETQHEAWLEEWRRNVEIDSTGNQLSVSYASESSLDLDGMKCLANRTLFALRKLLENLAALKKENQSFNHLLVPTVFTATNAVCIVRMEFSVIEDFSASLLKYTTSLFEFCEGNKAIHAEWNLKMIRGAGVAAGLGYLSILVPPLFPFAFAAYVGTAAAAIRDREKRNSSLTAQLHELIVHRESLVSIMRQLFQSQVHSVPNRQFLERVHYSPKEFPLDLEQNILHFAAIIAQTLCLALQSYSQAHIGEFEFSCLDHSIPKVNLLGGGEKWLNSAQDSQWSITASLQPLTCFGEMVKGPLLVFQDSAESELSDKSIPRDLIATPEDLANIWGPTSFLYDTSSTELDILAIHIGGGVLLPSSPIPNETSSPTLWHWRREADPGLSEAEAWSNIKSIAHRNIKLNTPIRIGIVVCNLSCPLSKPKEQEQLRNLAQAHLHAIAAFAPHWELTTVQAGVQAFQWVTPQFMAGWSKFPGQTRKQDIVRPGSFSFISELSNASGVLVCLCTGIAQRVPLRVVVAKCMDSYMNDLFPYMADWSALRDAHQMIKAFENPETDLSEWQKHLPKELHKPAGTIVKMILNRIQHTGVDHENVLNVAWPRAERGFDSLKIPCRGENTWVKILTDSLDNATFACITPSCLCLRLNTPSTRHKCLGIVPKTWDATRPYCLATQVRLTPRDQEGASELIPDDWKLQAGREYWIGPDDLMLVATCIEQNAELILQVKRIKVPVRTFKRIIKKSTIRETNGRGASDCLVVATTV